MKYFSTFRPSFTRTRIAGLVLLAVLLTLFVLFNRVPKLDTVRQDLAAVAAPTAECFQGFCIEGDPDASLLSRWWAFSMAYLRLVTVGMTFAFLVAGLTEVFLFPNLRSPGFFRRRDTGHPKRFGGGRANDALFRPASYLCRRHFAAAARGSNQPWRSPKVPRR